MLVNVNYSIIHHYHLLIRTNKNYNFDTSRSTVQYKRAVYNEKQKNTH